MIYFNKKDGIEYMPKINERIKERRLHKGFTLLEVADVLGVKEATVQRYESGAIKNISHETICKLSSLFGCSPSYLMGWEDKVAPASLNNYSNDEKRLLSLYNSLNDDGKQKLIERAEELHNLGYVKGDVAKMA